MRNFDANSLDLSYQDKKVVVEALAKMRRRAPAGHGVAVFREDVAELEQRVRDDILMGRVPQMEG